MIPKTCEDAGLDGLLKSALADDLPDDAAAGMAERITAFRARMKEEKRPAAPFWLFRRGIWATLAVLMLAAGFLLQGFKTPTPLADGIALIKTGISNSDSQR